MTLLIDLERDGFALVPGVLNERLRNEILREAEGLLSQSPAGVRRLAAKTHGVPALARSAAVRALVEPVLGSGAQLVRSILFNKSEQANWQAAWRQDLAIAVVRRTEVEWIWLVVR